MKSTWRGVVLGSAMLAAAYAGTPAAAQKIPQATASRSPAEILASAPDTAWRAIDPQNMLVLDLESGARIVMELAPDFAPVHVSNIRALAAAHFFDGLSIVRVQDNYVVQFGDASKTPLPAGVVKDPPAEYDRSSAGLGFRPLGYRDTYAETTGNVASWPVARDGDRAWLTHCYGMLGVGREEPPDVGNGAELYVVIGQAPRNLDRNLALVGRVLVGMEILSPLPRGTGAMGFYERPDQKIKIRSIRIGSDLSASDRPHIEVLDSDSESFALWSKAARTGRRRFSSAQPAQRMCVACWLPYASASGSATYRTGPRG
ncbi:MAG: peptidylprolyl isomerase [Alphaproteobacteria bacterium]